LGCLPGISEWLCGCFVIYRNDSKSRWLEIPPTLLSDPEHGPVSRATTTLLAHQALVKTPEARYGLAVTGDVGPGAPPATDGVVYCALVDIGRNEWEARIRLESSAPTTSEDVAARVARLDEATRAVLQFAIQSLS